MHFMMSTIITSDKLLTTDTACETNALSLLKITLKQLVYSACPPGSKEPTMEKCLLVRMSDNVQHAVN